MKDWSSKPTNNWRVKIYFDTNILMFVSDKSHEGLNYAIEYLNSKNTFIDFISSQYALFEFLENRKKKHYKKYLSDNKISETGRGLYLLNLLFKRMGYSIIKYDAKFKWRNYYSFNIAGFSYLNIYQDVLTKVEKEIASLRDWGIDYQENVFNSDLFEPTKSLCLTSRVGRHDCMITTSAVFPDNSLKMKDIVIWTGDEDYFKAFNECTETQTIFKDNKPQIEWISDLKYNDKNGNPKSLNLEKKPSKERVDGFMKSKMIQYIIDKNKGLFIGETEKASKKKDIVYVTAKQLINFPKDGIYLTIIGKDLDFIISSKAIDSFWLDGTKLTEENFGLLKVGSVASVKWELPDSHKEWEADIIATLKESGHYVFFTPES